MNKDYYISLIYKELKNELSDTEVQELSDFCKSSADNRALRDEIQLSWMLSQTAPTSPHIDIDTEADLQVVKNKLQQTTNQAQARVVPMWKRLARVAAILLPLIFAAIYFFRTPNTVQYTQIQATDAIKEVILKDGSSIWLKPNSSISFANDFNDTHRTLQLSGEAFFEVAKDPNKTFRIHIDDLEISVLGTSFNVKGYTNTKPQLSLSVVSGRVKIKSSQDSLILAKDDRVVFDQNSQSFSTSKLNNKNEMAWRTGRFVYKNEALSTVIAQLEDLYATSIQLQNTAIEDCGISLVINSTDFPTILNQVANAVKCEIKQTANNSFELSGGACN